MVLSDEYGLVMKGGRVLKPHQGTKRDKTAQAT